MSVPVCDWCDAWIDDSNVRWPGFCSSQRRDDDQQQRHQRRDRPETTEITDYMLDVPSQGPVMTE